jgi:hypothetical protein
MKGQKGMETKRVIRKQAFKMFLTRGYDTVSLRDIEDLTRLSRGGTLYHYTDKPALFMDVIDYYILQTEESYLPEKFPDAPSLLEFIRHRINLFEEKFAYYRQFLLPEAKVSLFQAYTGLLLQAMAYCPDCKIRLEDISDRKWQRWKNVLEKAQKIGEISSRWDCADIAGQFKYMFEGVLIENGKENTVLPVLEKQCIFIYSLIKP